MFRLAKWSPVKGIAVQARAVYWSTENWSTDRSRIVHCSANQIRSLPETYILALGDFSLNFYIMDEYFELEKLNTHQIYNYININEIQS